MVVKSTKFTVRLQAKVCVFLTARLIRSSRVSKTPSWQAWEQEIQSKLGLDSTICSGNKWNDIGDATDNNSPRDDSFRLLVDCKQTDKFSFSLKRADFEDWLERGLEKGKRALLAIRLWPRELIDPMDVVVIGLDDFCELLERVKQSELS
jgi:hypothetical protein